MVERQQKILIQLATAEGALTSEQLARQMNVSSRTIKSDMVVIGEELRQNGAELVSRRNRGYSLRVVNGEAFQSLYSQVRIKANRTSSRSEGERLLYIARKLVASEGGVLVDELAEELFLSRGGLRVPLREAIQFLESFHLQVSSAPGQGIRVVGEEYLRRVAATELYEIHFHTAELGRSDPSYAGWVECDYQERQDIRHEFLRVLRESPFALRDSATQRISWYLVVARNRRRKGAMVTLPARWLRELTEAPITETARQIYESLARMFEGFEVDDSEVCVLSVLLALGQSPDPHRRVDAMPYVLPAAKSAADSVIRVVKETTGADLDRMPGGRALLVQAIVPIAVKSRYGLDGYRNANDINEDAFLRMPLELRFARLMGAEISRELGCRVSAEDLSAMACVVNALLWRVKWPVRPLKLAMTSTPGGTAMARMAARSLTGRWGELIDSVTAMELYEVRGREKEYDAILLGCVQEDVGRFSYYNYDTPAAPVVMTSQEENFVRVYNTILTDAFRFRELLPPPEIISVREDFRCSDAEQAFQFLAARYGRDPASEAQMLSIFRAQERRFTMAQEGCAFVFAEPGLCKEERMDLFRMDRPWTWGGHRVEWLMFVCLRGEDLRRMKAMSVVLSALVQDPGKIRELAKDPQGTMVRILRENVQIA